MADIGIVGVTSKRGVPRTVQVEELRVVEWVQQNLFFSFDIYEMNFNLVAHQEAVDVLKLKGCVAKYRNVDTGSSMREYVENQSFKASSS